MTTEGKTMCTCAIEVEAKAKDKIRESLPEDLQRFTAELQGLAWIFGESVSVKNKLNLHIEYDVPKRKGDGFTRKKQDMAMIGNYCMFCGEKYEKDKPKAA